tara:strand:+ start:495 stop:764 length:270 start_codon:yes stop_codon:yes gene_type:complete
MSKKGVWAILIMFFIFIFGLPLMSYVSIISGKMHSLHSQDPKVTLEILEEKKAILKAEHDKQIAENMKKLHNGTYKPRPWAGWPWNREE